LCQFPGQGMLTATRSNQQHIHRHTSSRFAVPSRMC
jgi:hypothetical protein